MDILLNPMQSFKVIYMTCNIFHWYVYSKTFSPWWSYSWAFSPNYLATKIIKVSVCIGCCLFLVGISVDALISHPFNSIFLLPGFVLYLGFSLRHIPVGDANRFFCEWLNLNPFSRIFVRFIIVTLTWHAFTSYSIVLPMYISDRVIHALSIYFRCIIYVTVKI